MFFTPLHSRRPARRRPVPADLWRRLDRLDGALQLELFSIVNTRSAGEPRQWAVTVRRRDSGAEQFTVSSDTIPFALALAVLQAEKQGLLASGA